MKQSGGRFILSDNKIKEFAAANLTPDNYTDDSRYYRNIPEHIIINSDIVKISKRATDNSLYGLIYKVTLKPNIESPLVKVNLSDDTPDHGDFGKTSCSMNTFFREKCLSDVRTFLIKVSFIDKNGETRITEDGIKLTAKKDDFIIEALSQNVAYERAFEYGESVVPACISPPIIDPIEQTNVIHPILTKLLEPEIDSDGWLKLLLTNAKKQNINEFGIIFMEFADGYKTLKEVLDDVLLSPKERNKAVALAKMAHLILYEKGLAQGDAHNQNVMINLDYLGFLGANLNGKALVIDFGRTQVIPKSDLERFGLSKNVKSEEYIQIFNYLRWVSNKRGRYQHPPYDWLVKDILSKEGILIRMCYEQRIWRTDQMKAKFEAAVPNRLKRNNLFSHFLNKADFKNFTHLRWEDVLKTYDYTPSVNLLKPTVNAVLANTPTRNATASSPEPINDPRSIAVSEPKTYKKNTTVKNNKHVSKKKRDGGSKKN